MPYEEKWVVTCKTNKQNQLKASFQKQKHEIQMSSQSLQDFLEEAVKMTYFSHSNVLKILGISLHNDKPCMILPFMRNENLKYFLVKNKMVIYCLLIKSNRF